MLFCQKLKFTGKFSDHACPKYAEKKIAVLEGSLPFLRKCTKRKNNPVMSHHPLFFCPDFFREALAIGSPVANVRATDADADDNGRVTYSLNAMDAPSPSLGGGGSPPSGGSGLFRVDPDTGVITLRSGLDREKRGRHTLTVTATDNAVPRYTEP